MVEIKNEEDVYAFLDDCTRMMQEFDAGKLPKIKELEEKMATVKDLYEKVLIDNILEEMMLRHFSQVKEAIKSKKTR